MKATRSTGPHASVQKYDLLTAMAIAGLNGKAVFQTSMLRLVALVTARYNWKLDELTVGQRDLARMWSVDERTVKREIKRLLGSEILVQLRPGVRGRVAAYRLNQDEIYRRSESHWEEVGPDFAARMDTNRHDPRAVGPTVVRVDFRPATAPDYQEETAWGRTCSRLSDMDPDLYKSWFSALVFEDFEQGSLRLRAPSSFVAKYIVTHHLKRLQDVATSEFGSISKVEITF
ncbi:DnaA N-terminal domain-containing protein [Paracoccus sp. PAMC 22219]|uniref:DnaA N-terminal domain-containing protein n=1 Tax=Paracoccus sp. PAMC 22219 TaxID=1569209 RepID=UPI0005A9D246|nr:DnaA N-terminal domain-containing protein [Paracoccus sp. PAMC 22219]